MERLADALATFISVDNARALVTMAELALFKEVHKVTSPSLKKEVYTDAKVVEGEEVTILRLVEQGTQTFFMTTSKIPNDKW